MAYKNPKAYTRPEAMAKNTQLNKEERRLDEMYQHRMREIAGGGGVDPRRRIEFAEGGMVQEDPRAMANLPRQAIHMEYPKNPFFDTGAFNPPFFNMDYEV
jgi:hypothetical protein